MLIEKRMKVPNGKLLIIKAEVEDKVKDIRIQGDFFFHPEDKLCLIEEALIHHNIKEMPYVLQKIIDENKIKLVGLTIESICELMSKIADEMETNTL